jgi:putative peptidoglycan lipid II flippase
VFIYLAIALLTIGPLQARGLALANAIQNSSHALILLFFLQRSLPGLRLGSALLPFLLRTVPAAGMVGGLSLVAWPLASGLGNLSGLLVVGVLAGLIYIALLLTLGVTEVRTVFTLVHRRLMP